MDFSIRTNFPDIQRKLDVLQSDIATKATVRAVNRTMEQAKVQMARVITQEFNVDRTYVRERLRIKRASAKGGRFRIEASLAGGGAAGAKRSANLIRFIEKSITLKQGAVRVRKEGSRPELRFQIKRKGGRKVIAGAFIGNKGRTVFIREDGAGRLPIRALQTIDVAQMFNTKRINSVIVRTMLTKFPEVWAREVRFYTQKFGGGR